MPSVSRRTTRFGAASGSDRSRLAPVGRRVRWSEEQLALAARSNLTRRLIASLLHEISQPLMVTRANADAAIRLLRGPEANQSEVRDALSDVVEASDRAAELLSRARALAFDASRREPVDVNTLIRQVCGWFSREAEHRNVHLALRLHAASMLVDAEASQIRQIVAALVANALDASAKETGLGSDRRAGEVSLRTTCSRSRVALTVADNGPGLDEAERLSLFEPFYSTRPGGLGLGLWASRRLAQGLGGSLDAEAGAAAGMTFRLELPMAAPDRESPRRQRE